MLVFHLIMGRGVGRWSESAVTPWQGKIAGLISLLLWIGFEAVRWTEPKARYRTETTKQAV